MKYAAIVAHAAVFSVALMCRVLDVAPSGYYAWRERAPSTRSTRDEVITNAHPGSIHGEPSSLR